MSASREKKARKEADAQGTSKRFIAREKEERHAASVRNAIVVTVIVVVLAVAALTITQSGIIERNTTAMTVGDQKLTVVDFNYYYSEAYASYVQQYVNAGLTQYLGFDINTPLSSQVYAEADEETGAPRQTWEDYFRGLAADKLQSVVAYEGEAKAIGLTLSDEDRKVIDTQMESLEYYCETNNLTVNKYLKSVYGKGMDVKKFNAIFERELLAVSFQQNKYKETLKSYSDEQINTQYAENKSDYDLIDYRMFFFDGAIPEPGVEDELGEAVEPTEEEKEAAVKESYRLANEMKDRITTEQSFIELSEEYAPEDMKEDYKSDTRTLYRGLSKANAHSDMAEWLFSENTKPGDATVVEVSAGAYVLYFVDRYRNEYDTVNIRHILISFKNGDSQEPTEEEDKAAKDKADNIYEKWLSEEKTEDSFAELAKINTTDSASAEAGGLYENVYKGEMVPEFEDWAFDPEREPGDSDIVKTSYGYHIMYFVSKGETYWRVQVRESLADAELTAYFEELTEGPYKAQTNPSGLRRTVRLP